MPSAYSNTFEAHREQFGVVPSSARSSSGTRGASKTVGDTTPKAKVPSTHQEGRPPTTTSTLPRIPVPPKSADGRRYTSASERRASEMPTRPGSSSQTQLVMTLLRNASASSSSARTPHGTAGMMLHTPTSSPALPSNVTGGTPQLMTEALLSLRASGADRISSWPLVATPSNGPKEGWTLNSSPRKDMSAPPSASSLPASTTTTTTGKRHHQPYSGPLHQALSRELVGIRLAHNRALRHASESAGQEDGHSGVQVHTSNDHHRHQTHQETSTDLDVLRKCAAFLHTLQRGTLARPDTAATSSSSAPAAATPYVVDRVLRMGDEEGGDHLQPPSPRSTSTAERQHQHATQALFDVVKQSCASTALETFLNNTLPKTLDHEWNVFETVTLPKKIRDDVAAPIIEAHSQMLAVDTATYERLEAELQHLTNIEANWAAQKDENKAEIDTMLSAAESNGETLMALDRRFQVLFDRHALEHAQSQEAKQRIELVDQLRRNEKTLKTEIIQMNTHLANVQRRKDTVVLEKTTELKAFLSQEEDIMEETRGLLSEKQWLSERHLSISMRYKEEVNRTRTIEAEIAELQKKMKRSYSDIPIGDHLTPRPRWTERLDVVTTYRLPAPKLTLDAADLHEEQEDSGIMDAGEDEMRRSQRGGASRRDLNQSMRKPALGLSTTNSFASMGGRKKTAGGGGYSFFGGSMMKGMSFLMPRGGGGAMAGQHAEVTDTTCGSFREMMLRIRERLSVQSELLRLAQENIKDFKDHYGHPLDLVANLCALNVASAGSCISKHAATAVQPIGQSGALVPQPSWSPHELAQRSLALWAAVLDGLVAKGDLSITHMEQTTPQALLRLVQRRCLASVASMSASQRAALYGMHGAARGGGTPQQRRSNQSALPEPAPFPAGREGSLSSPASTATPLTRAASGSTSRPAQVSISGTAATPTTPAGTHNGSHGATTATTSSTTMTFGKAVADEIQFAQLWHTLTKQLEAYANHVAGCAPSLLDSSFAGGGSSQVGLQRRASVASFNGKNNALKRGGGNSGGRPLGDALRAIHVLGVDPDTGAPLDRIAVVTAMALIAFSAPPRMLEDVGTFLEAVERAAMETSSSEETVSAVAAHACGDWIGVRSFVQRVKDVCSAFGFGSIAAGELESHILRVSVGGTVPIGLGGAVGQSGVLGTSVSAVGGGAATGASPSPSSTLLPHHNNSNDSFASPMKHNAASSPSKDMGGGGGGSGSSGAYLLRDVRLPSSLSSRSASTTSLAWSSKVSLGETTVTSTKYPHHSSNSSNGMAALDRRSFAASGNLASSHNHSTTGGGSSINRAGSKVSPLSATALAEESSLDASSAHTPSSSSIVPYRTVFAVGPQWKGFLDCVVKHHQLQQHHILYWLSKTLVEHCFPSETMPGVFVIPARILETKLPQHYWNVDDPMFPDIGAMMDYYHRYPMPLVKEERRRSTGLAVPTSSGSAGASRGSGSRGEKPIDGSVWKLHVTRLMETIIQACDAGAGSEHFPAASPTSRGGSGAAVKKKPFALQMTDDPLEWSVSSDSSPAMTSSPKGRAVFTTPPSSPRASPRSQPQSGSTGGANRNGSGEAGGQRSPSNGNNNATTRNSKGSSIVSLHTQESAGPTTPLGVYLRYAQRASQAAKKTSLSTTGDEVSYVWRPPTQRPATQDDFYDVEEVFQHLSTTPLRQYMYQ